MNVGNIPPLARSHQVKERFYSIWERADRVEAVERYDQWLTGLPSPVAGQYAALTTASANWRDEIFAHFDHPVTNAHTESFNCLVRHADRIGRGYSFEALRARMLYTPGLRGRVVGDKRGANIGQSLTDVGATAKAEPCGPPIFEVRALIHTLSYHLEFGEFTWGSTGYAE